MPIEMPSPDEPKIVEAVKSIVSTVRDLAEELGLTDDEATVALFLALGVVSDKATLATRAHLATCCSLLDADVNHGG